MTKAYKRDRLQNFVKIGIVKQMHKDHLITDEHYQNLLRKYSKKGEKI